MALRAVLLGAAARQRAACRAATLAPHLSAAAAALPLGNLPTRLLSFPTQHIHVKIHVAAAFPSSVAAGEEGNTGRLDGGQPGSKDARKPATKMDLWDLKHFIRSERAAISRELKEQTRLIHNKMKDQSSDHRKQARRDSNRQILFTILIAIVMEAAVLVVSTASASKKTNAKGMTASGTSTGTEMAKSSSGVEKAISAGVCI